MDEKSCSTENIIISGTFRLRYSINGVDYRDLPVVDEKVKSLILSFK